MKEILEGKKIVVYEVVPPRGANLDKCMRLCDEMLEAGVSTIAVTDMPTSRVKVAPWAVGRLLVEKGVDPLIHFTRISRNLLRIESDLLGIHALGMRNVLILSGDDPKGGDYPSATAVNDLSTSQLIKLVKEMNEGRDLAGKKLLGKTEFLVGGVFNPHVEWDLKRAEDKVNAGADFLISQPVYKPEVMEKARRVLSVPILVSVAFFSSFRQLEYFSKIPGIEIPTKLIEDLEGKGDEYVEEKSFEYLLGVIEKIFPLVNGLYISGIVKSPQRVRRLVEFARDLQS